MGAGLSLAFLMRNKLNINGIVLSGPLINLEGISWDQKIGMYLFGKKLNGIVHLSSVSISTLLKNE